MYLHKVVHSIIGINLIYAHNFELLTMLPRPNGRGTGRSRQAKCLPPSFARRLGHTFAAVPYDSTVGQNKRTQQGWSYIEHILWLHKWWFHMITHKQHICIYIYTYICIYTYIYIYTHIYIYTYICILTCIYIYIFILTCGHMTMIAMYTFGIVYMYTSLVDCIQYCSQAVL